jgi:hypothetical protein
MIRVICNKCETTCPPRQWRRLGWIRAQISYTNGNRVTLYVCVKCRSKPTALFELEPKSQEAA